MTHHFEIVRPRNPLIVCNTGVQLAKHAQCVHGQHAVLVSLIGRRQSHSPGTHERLDTVLPRCVLTELLGALQTQIRRTEGTEALQDFLDEIAEHAAASDTLLDALHTQGRDCCEAGFRTHGTEHTCGRGRTA